MLALTMSGCQYKIKLDGLSDEKRIFVNCFPGSTDTTLISVYVAKPVNYKGEFNYNGNTAKVSMWVDGKEIDIRRNDGISENFPEGTKFVTASFLPGQKVRLEVSMDGLETASGESVVPDAFPEYEIRFRKTTKMIADLKYKSDAPGYFGMRIIRQERRYDDGQESYRYNEYESPDYDSDSDNDLAFSEADKITTLNFGDGTFIFWEDATFPSESGTRTFSVPLQYRPDTEEPGLSFEGQEVTVRIESKYKFKLYRLTREMYNYLYSRYAEANDALASAGLAPATFSYSNITGGYGILGPVQMTESEWMDNLKE